MIRRMLESLAAIEAALAIVQKTLDTLSERGDHEAAYELARAQFTASLRASWPGNLSGLVKSLGGIAADASLHLNDDERAEVRKALEAFKGLLEQ
jgi:hypothetical protein